MRIARVADPEERVFHAVPAADGNTFRELQGWCRAKSFDAFYPLGPWVDTPEEFPSPLQLSIRGQLNGATMQESNTVANPVVESDT